jgi:hypothetical protein
VWRAWLRISKSVDLGRKLYWILPRSGSIWVEKCHPTRKFSEIISGIFQPLQRNGFLSKIFDMTKTLLLLLCPTWLWAQARLGWTEEQIRAEFSDAEFEIVFSEEPLKLGDDVVLSKRILQVKFGDKKIVSYYFNSEGISKLVSIHPLTEGVLHGMIELYNKKYVIVSDTEWKFYGKGGVLKIRLALLENGDYYFIFF